MISRRCYALMSLACLAIVSSIGSAISSVASFIADAIPRLVDAGTAFRVDPTPRSIFETRRAGLA